MKYVRLDHSKHAMPAILFALGDVIHHELAFVWMARGWKPVGAGEVRVDLATGKLVTYGRSNSLNLAPACDDADIINALQDASMRPVAVSS